MKWKYIPVIGFVVTSQRWRKAWKSRDYYGRMAMKETDDLDTSYIVTVIFLGAVIITGEIIASIYS